MKRIYTRNGDNGSTKDYSGREIPKDDPKIIVVGKIDTLQAAVDTAAFYARDKNKEILEWVQKKLGGIAGEISCAAAAATELDLKILEAYTESYGAPPKTFVRFNTLEALALNECRVRCRELETSAVKLLRTKEINNLTYRYLNRASSLFFMMAYCATK